MIDGILGFVLLVLLVVFPAAVAWFTLGGVAATVAAVWMATLVLLASVYVSSADGL